MKFPLLIRIKNKQSSYIVNSVDELPIGIQFTIVTTTFNDTIIDGEYRVKDDGQAPEDTETLEPDLQRFDASEECENGSGTCSQERDNISGSGKETESSISENLGEE